MKRGTKKSKKSKNNQTMMKKIIVFVLIVLIIFMVGSCWFNQNRQETKTVIEPRKEVDGGLSILTPTPQDQDSDKSSNHSTEAPKENSNFTAPKSTTYLSAISKRKVLFDATTDAHYVLSTTKELAENKTIQLDMTGDRKIETITLGLDHPNGVKVLAIKNGIGVNLMNSITEGPFFDDYGDLLQGYSIQVTVLDIDQIKGKEIVISVGKSNKRIDSYLFYADNSGFKYIGSLVSKGAIKLVGNELKLKTLNGQDETYAIYQKRLTQIVI